MSKQIGADFVALKLEKEQRYDGQTWIDKSAQKRTLKNQILERVATIPSWRISRFRRSFLKTHLIDTKKNIKTRWFDLQLEAIFANENKFENVRINA